jgi:hypothetical protein
VFSTTMDQSPDPAVELVSADPLETVRALKAEDGLDIWSSGVASWPTRCCPRSTAWSSSSVAR